MISVIAANANAVGDLFAARMADLIHALGYNIERMNLHRTGRELDIIAVHRLEGRRAIIECKATSEKIGGADVNKFVGALDAERRRNDGAVIGYFVSLSGFKDSALEQESEFDNSRCVLMGPAAIAEELQAANILVSTSEAMVAAQRIVTNPNWIVESDVKLLATETGWAWLVNYEIDRVRAAWTLVHADGTPIPASESLEIAEIAKIQDNADLAYCAPPVRIDTDNRILSDYLRFTVSETCSVTHEGLPADAEVGHTLRLEELYVPLTLEYRRGSGTLVKEAEKPQDPADSQVGKIAKASLGSAIVASKHLAILGAPGSGKSTLLRRIALAYAEPDSTFITDNKLPSESLLPLIVRCREIVGSEASLPTLIGRIAANFTLDPADQSRFLSIVNERLRSGSALLLVDGLDEIPETGLRTSFARNLRTFISMYPLAYLVVTSREAGFRPVAGVLAEACTNYRIADLTNDSIESLVTKWHDLVPYRASSPQRTASSISARILDNDRLRRLASNPLLLTTILLVERWVGDLPRKRSVLYDKAIEVLLITWNVEGHRPLDLDEVLPQLSYVAHSMTTNGLQQVASSDLVRLLNQARSDLPDILATARTGAIELLDRIELRSSLLSQAGYSEVSGRLQATFEFKHLTFQEYLTALACVQGWTPSGVPISDPDAIFGPHFDDPRWSEVISLATALAGRSATTIIRSLLRRIHTLNDQLAEANVPDSEWDNILTRETTCMEVIDACLADEVAIHPEVAEAAIRARIELGSPHEAGFGPLFPLLGGRFDGLLRGVVENAVNDDNSYLGAEYCCAAAEIFEYDRAPTNTDYEEEFVSQIKPGIHSSEAIERFMACSYVGMLISRCGEGPELFENGEEFEGATDAVSSLFGDIVARMEFAERNSSTWTAAGYALGRYAQERSVIDNSQIDADRVLLATLRSLHEANDVSIIEYDILDGCFLRGGRVGVDDLEHRSELAAVAEQWLQSAEPAKDATFLARAAIIILFLIDGAQRSVLTERSSNLGLPRALISEMRRRVKEGI